MSDVHVDLAAEVLGIPPEQVTPAQRRAAKAINFAQWYGATPPQLVDWAGKRSATIRTELDPMLTYMARKFATTPLYVLGAEPVRSWYRAQFRLKRGKRRDRGKGAWRVR